MASAKMGGEKLFESRGRYKGSEREVWHEGLSEWEDRCEGKRR